VVTAINDESNPINNNIKNILLMKLSREQMELLGFREIIEPVQIYKTTENKSLGTCKFCAVLCINGCHKDSCICCLREYACNHTDGPCTCSNPEAEKRPSFRIVKEKFLVGSEIVTHDMCYGVELMESVQQKYQLIQNIYQLFIDCIPIIFYLHTTYLIINWYIKIKIIGI
jgi:hypothetical protein